MFPAHSVPLKIYCIFPQKSEFYRISRRYGIKILNPPHRYQCKAHGIEHAISTNGKIVKSKLRRTFLEIQKIIDSQITEWLTDDTVSRSVSPYSSCLHVVPKKSGKHRVCVDYRNPNATSVLESYPIPHLHFMMDNLFSSLDLKSVYYNVSTRKQDRLKTALITKSGCFEFNYLPFGLKSAPLSLMRFIHEVLHLQDPELHEHIKIYLDDILIHIKDESTHIIVPERLCKCLNEFNLGINLSKCVLGEPSLSYFGFTITGNGYCATNEKVKATVIFPCQKQFGN